jgi:hypothetical protein
VHILQKRLVSLEECEEEWVWCVPLRRPKSYSVVDSFIKKEQIYPNQNTIPERDSICLLLWMLRVKCEAVEKWKIKTNTL